jgi:hypothetical protein
MQATSMDTTPKTRRRKTRSDLVHLRSLSSTQPATKIGQVTWAWVEIKAGLAAGVDPTRLGRNRHTPQQSVSQICKPQSHNPFSNLREQRENKNLWIRVRPLLDRILRGGDSVEEY